MAVSETANSATRSEHDDLTRITGIGPEIAQRLDEAGIRTYADLGACSASEIAKLLPDISPLLWGCIDNWRHEAQEFATGTAAPPERSASAAGNGQHYQSFVVRIALNDDGSIRDTRMEHIGTGEVKRWAGWEHEAMLGFIKAAGAAPAAPAASAPRAAAVGPPYAKPHPEPGPAPAVTAEPTKTGQLRRITRLPVRARMPSPPAGSAAPGASAPRLFAPVVTLQPDRTLLHAEQPFTVTVGLELTDSGARSERLAYSAVIVARQLGGRSKRTLASSRGLLAHAGTATITIGAEGLPAGVYRLEGAVSLRAAGASRGDVAAVAEGIMLQVLPF
jgi:Helix-hairpin-helix domain